MQCLNPIHVKHPTLRKSERDFREKYLQYNPDFKPYLLVPCGKCDACRKRRAADWRLRMIREIGKKPRNDVFFGTLTVDRFHYDAFVKNTSYYIRKFLELYRFYAKKSLRHWFVSELGEKKGRLHIHFLIFGLSPKVVKRLPRTIYRNRGTDSEYTINKTDAFGLFKSLWKLGYVWIEHARGLESPGYIVKYMLKPNPHDLDFVGRVWASPGLGRCWVTKEVIKYYQYGDRPPLCSFRCPVTGRTFFYALPRYYINKIWEEEERRMRSIIQSLEPWKPKRLNPFVTFQTELDYVKYMVKQCCIHHVDKIQSRDNHGVTEYYVNYWYQRLLELKNLI